MWSPHGTRNMVFAMSARPESRSPMFRTPCGFYNSTGFWSQPCPPPSPRRIAPHPQPYFKVSSSSGSSDTDPGEPPADLEEEPPAGQPDPTPEAEAPGGDEVSSGDGTRKATKGRGGKSKSAATKSKAKAKAQLAKESKLKIKELQADQNTTNKKYKELKDRFRKHRSRKPDDPLSQAYKAKGPNIKAEELEALLNKFAAESKAKESVTKTSTETNDNVEREGEVRKTYPELLDHYKVDDDADGHVKLDTYFKMNYFRKVKVPKQQAKVASSLNLTDGFKFVYFVKAWSAKNKSIPLLKTLDHKQQKKRASASNIGISRPCDPGNTG